MKNIKRFNSFDTSYKKLKERARNSLLKVFIECYHNDFESEPFISIEASLENVSLEEVEGHGKVINILTKEVNLSLSERNYRTNLSGDTIVFSSKLDDETYYFIQFI